MDIKEQLEKAKEMRKNALLIALTILILCLISVLILHKYDEYQNLDKEVKSLENDVALLKFAASPQMQSLLEKKKKETDVDLETTKEKLETMKKIIPSKPDLDRILNIISIDAKKSMVTLNSLKPSAEESIILFYDKNTNKLETFNPQSTNNQNKVQDKNKKQEQKVPENAVTFKKININVDVSGNFNSIENFLGEISKSERFISIENISIKKEGGTLRTLISLSAYYLPEQQ